MLYVVKYSGPFGFIKPWTAVRDSETFSQQFLTPSIIEGLRQKLEVSEILRHKITYEAIIRQQEVTQTRGWQYFKTKKYYERPRAILIRGVMLNPDLYLGFSNEADAEKAYSQNICLCRNEDVLFPKEMQERTNVEFNSIEGFELRFKENENSFLVGFNRFEDSKPMYGYLEVTGNPLKKGKQL
ncbi:MAG TPA: hypothetical protein VHD35_04445 [Chitinophagaceae bacterium]|nr:hypothetical protein [Chitinophagaceae bacterium]